MMRMVQRNLSRPFREAYALVRDTLHRWFTGSTYSSSHSDHATNPLAQGLSPEIMRRIEEAEAAIRERRGAEGVTRCLTADDLEAVIADVRSERHPDLLVD